MFNPKLLFKTKAPPDLRKYIGRNVKIDGKNVIIVSIVGNMIKPAFLEINGEHLIGMLRFFAQMNNDKSITEEEFQAFEEMDMEAERIVDQKPVEKKIDGQKKSS